MRSPILGGGYPILIDNFWGVLGGLGGLSLASQVEGAQFGWWHVTILSRASEAGSPTNRPGSDKTRGQGSFDNYLDIKF